jgi:hypothetical protein
MKTGKIYIGLLASLVNLAIIALFSTSAFAVDDGPRAYWKGRDGTHGVSVQYLNLNMQNSGSQQFAPGQYIYANSDIEATIFVATYARYMTLFKRPSSLAVNLAGGSIDADVSASLPSEFLPPSETLTVAFTESASGYADPTVQLVVNLFGTPPLKANFDLLDYEPTWTIDAAVMLGVPLGNYDKDKMLNLGLNRWFGRIALPIKYHFGVFTPGYRKSFELTPSVWLFDKNDDFLGQKLESDPMWQIEAHLTNDFTPSFFGSLDLLYRTGFKSKIDGIEAGDDIEVGNLGFTLSYQVTDNLAIHNSISSNVFGNDDMDNSIIRTQFVYGWHRDYENMKKLQHGH